MKRARRSDHTKRYGRLHPEGLASTILTKCDPHWGSYIHPNQDRIISVREAARFQAFPDHIQFLRFTNGTVSAGWERCAAYVGAGGWRSNLGRGIQSCIARADVDTVARIAAPNGRLDYPLQALIKSSGRVFIDVRYERLRNSQQIEMHCSNRKNVPRLAVWCDRSNRKGLDADTIIRWTI